MTTPRQLPERPNLDQLKRQAKELLHSAHNQDSAALARFRTLPAFARLSDQQLAQTQLALHDAQSVIAREFGFASWNALRERVEELTLDFSTAVDQFIEAATDGRSERAERLLALQPRIAGASFHTALLLGDVGAVESRLAANPALALEPGGPRNWEPLLYLCHNSMQHAQPEAVVAIARRLLALGADPNARFPWLHHNVRRPVLWGAVHVTRMLPLAKVLLEAGADPNDGVTLPLAAGGGNIEALELLHAHGADVNQPWATDGSSALYSMLAWARTSDGAHWLVEHGADADAVFEANGETPLHMAARKGNVFLTELLVERGADINRRRADGRTAYALAELNANRAVADWLLAHGAVDDLSDVDRFIAACSRGERARAQAMLHARPALREQIRAEHYIALHQAAERGDTNALETMLVCGFDPNRADEEIGKTALHSAAHAGRPESVKILLAHGASVFARDREFHGQPLVWAADGVRSHDGNAQAYNQVAKLLLDAGSPVEWETGEEPADSIVDIITEWRNHSRDPGA